MLAQHDLVIHLVDVVASKDQDVIDVVAVDDIDVLGHSIGSAEIPLVLLDTLRSGQDIKIFIPFRPEEVPAALAMAD